MLDFQNVLTSFFLEYFNVLLEESFNIVITGQINALLY